MRIFHRAMHRRRMVVRIFSIIAGIGLLMMIGIFIRGKRSTHPSVSLPFIVSPTFLPFAGTTQMRTIVSKGLTRTFLVHVPTSPEKPQGLILVYHGSGDNGAHMEEYSGLSNYAQGNGFIMVYLTTYNGFWADGRGREADQAGIDDRVFTSEVIALVEKEYDLHNEEVDLVGFSNGGYMVQHLLCQSKMRFSSVVSVGASSIQNLADSCSPVLPTRLFLSIGSYDPTVEGAYLETGAYLVPFYKAVTSWSKTLGCSKEIPSPDIDPVPPVEYRHFTDCTDESLLVSALVSGLDHDWIHTESPGAYDTTEDVWRFITGSF